MFKELFSFFKGKNLIEEAYSESLNMLKDAFFMFEAAKKSLRETDSNEVDIDVHKYDKKINKYEREVRKKVLTNLSITGTTFLNPGLVLVSIVVDIERIGDYTKNIAELAMHNKEKLVCGIFEEDIKKIEEMVDKRFKLTIEALEKTDEEKAKEVMEDHKWITSTCDKILFDLIAEKDKSIEAGRSVSIALYARYLKRVASHLTNIATGIVNPFHRIGFFGEPERET